MTKHLIIDTSVLIQGFIEDSETKRVQLLIKSLNTDTSPKLHYPDIGLSECANVLWKQYRFRNANPDQVKTSLRNLIALPLVLYSVSPYLSRALEISLGYDLAVYDGLYIALAEKLSYPLVSVDQKQRKVATLVGVTLLEISEI